MKIEEYFGNYEENNFNLLENYMKELNDYLNPYYNFNNPFFKGDNILNYNEYLKDKKLNYESLSSEELFEYISPYFKNIPNWNNPGTMINVIPPVNLMSLATVNILNMYNPNFAQDTYAGNIIMAELEVSKYMSDLVGWNYKHAYGTFTFGGKGTNLYATKVAINKADKLAAKEGCLRNKYFMVTSKNGHPCHLEVCNWLGIGSDNCYEIVCDSHGKINIDETRKIIEQHISNGKIFLGYNLTAGSTNELYVDDIYQIYKLNLEIVDKYKLNYRPHIHADAVLGWVYLFFNDYDFKENKLNVKINYLKKIKSLNKKIKQLKYADSIGIDFHKTGFAPYISSMVLFKNRNDYFTLNEKEYLDYEKLEYGNYNPYKTTLELTRSSQGPVSALCNLKSLGINGYQKIIADMFSATEYFREQLEKNKNICLINKDTEGLASLFLLKPRKYQNYSIKDFLKLGENEIDYIRQFNVNYGKFILEEAKKKKISFIYTSSRSYVIPGTNIKLGVLKAYPMSVFLNNKEVDRIIVEINQTIEKYLQLDFSEFSDKITISDTMVYR